MRFSIKTAFEICTCAIVCVFVFNLITKQDRERAERNEAFKQTYGATYGHHTMVEEKPVWNVVFNDVPKADFPGDLEFERIEFKFCTIDSEQVARMHSIENLECLMFTNCNFERDAMIEMQELKGVRSILFWNSTFDPTYLELLAKSQQLKKIILKGSVVAKDLVIDLNRQNPDLSIEVYP
ncbi:MAG: hypothetical protein AAF483_24025 [Planctomycetota bacterium]